MSIFCAMGGHEAGPGETYNSGYWFGCCRRCGRDMIRTGASWDVVPPGHRVVWKSGPHSHAIEPDYSPVLPALHRDANLPAVRSPFASWSRQLLAGAGKPIRNGAAAPAAAAAEADEIADRPLPGLLIVVALVGAGLQLIFGLGGRGGY